MAMKTLLGVVFFCFTISAAQSQSFAAERGLLAPDWNDPSLSRARKNLEAAPRSLAPHTLAPRSTAREGEIPLSLPRWGLGQRIDNLNSAERALSRSAVSIGAPVAWPKCAARTPKTEYVRDKTGVWYSDQYNFGCIIISISGDRAFNPDLKFPTGLTVPDDCSEEARAAPPVDDSEGDAHGRFELQLSLNRLPYTLSGSCLQGAEAFCRNRAAQCALVGRLILLEGSPQ
jgi:hypothetical protein